MKPILLTAAGNTENQDRGIVIHDGPRVVLCVADGAGGRSGGTEAANRAVEFVSRNVSAMSNADFCVELLLKMDAAIVNDPIAGETTCALAIVSAERIVGTCRERRPDVAAQQLIELVRYPSGVLPDDVTIIVLPLST